MRRPVVVAVARPTRTETVDALPTAYRAAIRRKLLGWYDRNRRDLPWRRRASDPYAQWVAEIMLQQTRVETVIDYYEPFLRRFPTVGALARADHDHVLKQWEGLGYYRRALGLHRAARLLHDRGGQVPDTAEALRELPGIGEYTSAAIASIAFNRREAAVDGNVARVLARLLGVHADVLSTEGKARIRDLAVQLVPVARPGEFNQAWMDLGSAVCTPKSPDCDRCPLQSPCVAATTGQADSLPVRNGKRRVVAVRVAVAVFVYRGRMLVRQRPTGGLWSGLWEFPNVDVATDPAASEAAVRGSSATGNGSRKTRSTACSASDRATLDAIEGLAQSEGVALAAPPSKVGTVSHALTHRALTFEVYECPVGKPSGAGAKRSGGWVTPAGFAKLSVSVAHRKVHTLFVKQSAD